MKTLVVLRVQLHNIMFKLKPAHRVGALKLVAGLILLVICIYILREDHVQRRLDNGRSIGSEDTRRCMGLHGDAAVTDIDRDTDGDEDGDEDYMIPRDEVLETMTESDLMKTFLNYVERIQVRCRHVIRVGRLMDGGKEICVDRKYRPQTPCLVYSFGINYEYYFDDNVVKKFGCDVHCFDPSMLKEETRKVSSNVWFYKWGLGSENTVNDKGWTIKTLQRIRNQLGHVNRTIDILKIDIEGDEWPSIPQIIASGALTGVNQISMEIHFSKIRQRNKIRIKDEYWGATKPAKALPALRLLYEEGFRIFMRERNLGGYQKLEGIDDYFTNVYELSFIRVGR